jgi:hypothetical protein
MHSHDREDGHELKVVDRRKFNSDGSLREGMNIEEEKSAPSRSPMEPERAPASASAPRETGSPSAPFPSAAPEAPAEGEPEEGESARMQATPFVSLLLSMATSAQIALGDVPHPGTGARHLSLEEAQGYIEIVEDLQRKTKGNLNKDEERLLTQLLYELKMRFVARQQEILRAHGKKRPS